MAEQTKDKTLWKLILGFLIIVGLIILVTQLPTCNSHVDNGNLSDQLQIARDSTKTFVNKYNQEVTTRREVEGSLSDIKAVSAAQRDSILDLVKRINKKEKDFIAAVEVKTTTNTDVPVTSQSSDFTITLNKDTCKEIKTMNGTFDNKFYHADVKLGVGASMHLQGWDQLHFVEAKGYKKGFLSKKWYTDVFVFGDNPDTKYTVTKAYRVGDTRPVKFVVGFYGGFGYDQHSFSPFNYKHINFQFGIGIMKPLFKIR